jgi:Rrf2 family protein
MKLSPAAEIAVRGAAILAMHYGEGPVTLDTICAQRDLPKQYLVKIFSSLAKAGLVRPVRGKKGGYLLTREPERITLLNVVEAVEGPLAMNYCQHNPPECELGECPVRKTWSEIQHFVSEKLDAMTLAKAIGR